MKLEKINKKQLGEYIFNLIKKDIKEKGFNLKNSHQIIFYRIAPCTT